MTTLIELLIGGGGDPQTAVERALGSGSENLHTFAVSGLSIPTVDVSSAIVSLLKMPIGTIAFEGWKAYRSVSAAKDATADKPGSRKVVRLLDHRMTSRQTPTIEVEYEGFTLPLLDLVLDVELRVSAVEIVVVEGEVVDRRPGAAIATARLSASDFTLFERSFTPVDLAGHDEDAKIGT